MAITESETKHEDLVYEDKDPCDCKASPEHDNT